MEKNTTFLKKIKKKKRDIYKPPNRELNKDRDLHPYKNYLD